MKVVASKPKIDVTFTLTEDEAVWLAQLAGRVGGEGKRASFYSELYGETMIALERVSVLLPTGAPYFSSGRNALLVVTDTPVTESPSGGEPK